MARKVWERKPNITGYRLADGRVLNLLAEAYGMPAMRVHSIDEFEKALTALIEGGRGGLIECPIDIDEMVRPMVGGGSDITAFMVD